MPVILKSFGLFAVCAILGSDHLIFMGGCVKIFEKKKFHDPILPEKNISRTRVNAIVCFIKKANKKQGGLCR